MPTVRVLPDGPEFEFDPAEAPFHGIGQPGSLLDLLLSRDFEISHTCGGNCSCTTCHVIIDSGGENLTAIQPDEDDRLDAAQGWTPASRLACQAIPRGDVSLRIPPGIPE